MARPWMPLYVSDYLADTGHLSTIEHGAYLLLIMHYWQNGNLPSQDEKLARIARMSAKEWERSRDTLASLFGDGWTHKRIDEELAKAEEMLSKRRQAGKAGASVRYSKGIANAKHVPKQTHSLTQGQLQSQDYQIDARSGAEFSFSGQVVRLSAKDFAQWKNAYSELDLLAELTARDAWLASDSASDDDRKRWFLSTSKYLANRNAEARTKRRASDDDTAIYRGVL
jgi:uncharacterized protein YdaU (DUF1376 family)